jgi:hypothetical protein
MVVIYALVPFAVLVGIPMLIHAVWRRLRNSGTPESDQTPEPEEDGSGPPSG